MSYPKIPRKGFLRIFINSLRSLFIENQKRGRRAMLKLLKSPLFYFNLTIFILIALLYFSCNDFKKNNSPEALQSFFLNPSLQEQRKISSDDLFFNQRRDKKGESPDFKTIQESAVAGISSHQIISGKVLGDILGSVSQERKEIIEYIVEPGDTLQSIAEKFGISVQTILYANDLTPSSILKVGQNLIILPVDGLLHIVKKGDTIYEIAKLYKVSQEEIVSFNALINEDDIYIGDILVIPGGTRPSSPIAPRELAVPDTYFVFPTEGKISQGLHYYNAVDIANKCGTPIYPAAAGIVQRVKYGWNFGGGNLVTILHPNGLVTYYGHLQAIFVKPGQSVDMGKPIGLMGGGNNTIGDGISTGCHLHFQVIGGKNPLAGYPVGTILKYK